MSVPYFFEQSIQFSDQPLVVSEPTSKHCVQVLRMRGGDPLRLTNGAGLVLDARILSADKQKTVVMLEKATRIDPPVRKISIGISLLKNMDRFEWMLEKITEIGVTEIIPLLCKRTEHHRFRQERMQQIVVSAMLQSQQAWLPALEEPTRIIPFIQSCRQDQRLIAHCEEDHKNLISELEASDDCLILIGPEGDFSPDEIAAALSHEFIPVSLGNTRLRTETAGVVSVTLLAHR